MQMPKITPIDQEWFDSQASASRAAKRVEVKRCYRCTIRWAMSIDGNGGWLLEIFSI